MRYQPRDTEAMFHKLINLESHEQKAVFNKLFGVMQSHAHESPILNNKPKANFFFSELEKAIKRFDVRNGILK